MSDRAVIFDVDGTLVDSNDAHAQAWTEAFNEFGIACDVATVRPLIGMGGEKLLAKIAGLPADSQLGRRIATSHGQRFRAMKVRPFPDTRALFRALIDDGVRVGIATSAANEELTPLLAIADVSDLIDQASSSDDVQSSKPDPDVVQAALQRLKARPQDTIMVGDTPYDIEAAARAGTRSIAFRCGGWSDRQLAGATAIYNDPSDMLANYRNDFGNDR